ncbi:MULTISPECIES: LON peptidase substrate-binding domain-containing protein [Giesbergeria]|uniref:LON peptidase substrate-binding domain-containing protein n=1 Tax=Giesbergeria sinuosa TaxID=80883 RepID=A0ABV9QC68_9BURK
MPAPLTLHSLPLFPLQVVLFPSGTLALRVFEVRYLDMVRKCQLAGAPFGVVALQQGQEVRRAGAGPEQFHAVGTLARIVQAASPQPGLIQLQAQGSQRFHITGHQLLPHGLWVADVALIPADPLVAIPADLAGIAQALAQVLDSLRERDPNHPLPVPTAAQLQDCGWVANRWCELLPVPLALRQQLMALDNPLLRLELVGDVLEKTGIVGS